MLFKNLLNFVVVLPLVFVGLLATPCQSGEKAKIVFVAGKPSHPARTHEHKAGCHLLADLLNEHCGDRIAAVVYENGWPEAADAFADAAAVVIFSDGGQRHPAFFHLKTLADLRARGIGLGAIHYAVEMQPGETNDALIASIGGAFEVDYSVNPHWVADFNPNSSHPVANGVKPFAIEDEWYFNMRFAEGEGMTPILSAVPPAETMNRADGHHSGNPEVRKMVEAREMQHLCWVYESPATESAKAHRGFGFTGGHFHDNWANDGYRKTALNAISWIAGVEIPEKGIESPTPDKEALDRNLDDKPAPKPKKKK